MDKMAWRSMRAASSILVKQRLDLTVEGREHLPPEGPVIVAARHFHHLYDGCILFSVIPRPLSILAALDWVKNPLGKRMMDALCDAARWPVVYRRPPGERASSISGRMLHRAVRESLSLLEEGRVLIVFPEAYPNIDPGFTPKCDETDFLPFEPGFSRLAAIAASRGIEVPIVPAGFQYQRDTRWRVHLAFGEPVTIQRTGTANAALHEIEARVRRLSSPVVEMNAP